MGFALGFDRIHFNKLGLQQSTVTILPFTDVAYVVYTQALHKNPPASSSCHSGLLKLRSIESLFYFWDEVDQQEGS